MQTISEEDIQEAVRGAGSKLIVKPGTGEAFVLINYPAGGVRLTRTENQVTIPIQALTVEGRAT